MCRPPTKLETNRRDWGDALLFSNLVYVIAAGVSLACAQYVCALFQIGAACASTLFHRSKETRYLLVDAIISSSLAVVFVFMAYHAYQMEWYGLLAVKAVQGVLCIFTWVYCGLPGGDRYDQWHEYWHYVSGMTTLTTTILLAMYVPHFDLVLHELVQDYMMLSNWISITY